MFKGLTEALKRDLRGLFRGYLGATSLNVCDVEFRV